MFGFMKKMFGGCNCSSDNKSDADRAEHAKKLQAAHEQDRQVRHSLDEGQIDKGLKDTMEASDPVAKY